VCCKAAVFLLCGSGSMLEDWKCIVCFVRELLDLKRPRCCTNLQAHIFAQQLGHGVLTHLSSRCVRLQLQGGDARPSALCCSRRAGEL